MSSKVAPESLLSPSHVLIITQLNKKAMDSSTSPDDMIKPMILTFDEKITLNQGLIRTAAESPISSIFNPPAGSTNEDYDKEQSISNSAHEASPLPEVELWPKLTELDDLPSEPPNQDAIKQVISNSAYLFPKQSELNDRPPSPSPSNEKALVIQDAYLLPKQTALNMDRPPSPSSRIESEKIRETAYQTERPSSPSYFKPQMQLIRENLHSAADEGSEKPKMQVIREAAYHDKLSEMQECYRSSPVGRLSRVVEESESFSRREFGADVLNYMSTHSSANHTANISTFSYKHPSYHHNNHSNFSYNHSSYQSGNFTSKSAPAGTAVRTGSAFALFRRGMSEGGNLGAAGRVYRRPRSSKPRSLAHTLLWPFLKIRNGYVGCMMGLEGAGDLSGMAQGGTYATKARYFADVPLSKTDSRNFG